MRSCLAASRSSYLVVGHGVYLRHDGGIICGSWVCGELCVAGVQAVEGGAAVELWVWRSSLEHGTNWR